MKKTVLNTLALATLFFASTANAQVGVGVPAGDIHPSAELEVKSTTKGFLPPRMTNAERNSIATPATGLLIYQTDAVANNPAGLYFYDGLVWKNGLGVLGAKGDQGLIGQTGAQGIQGPKGDVGATGAKGDKGQTGANGPKGDIGAQGVQGEFGIQGVTGDQGPKGDQGEQGPAGTDMPSGIILPFAGSTVPSGYLLCDGSEVSRATYSNLFATLSVSWGSGNGTTTFNLPDLRGRFMRGVDGTAGNDPDAESRTAVKTGGNVGNNVGSVQADELKSHSHTYFKVIPMGSIREGGYINRIIYEGDAANETSLFGGTETRPKNVNVNYIIKF